MSLHDEELDRIGPAPVAVGDLLAQVEHARQLQTKSTRTVHPLDHAVECLDCHDRGWIEKPAGLHPCKRCNPVAYRRLHDGHYRDGHERCEECALVRRGEVKVGRDVDPVTGAVRPGVLHDD